MVGIVRSEIVAAGEVFFGTHVEVVVVFIIQHGVQSFRGRNTDGAGGETGVQVGVIGRVERQVGIRHPLPAEVSHGKAHCWVGLQGHTSLQAVDVETRHNGLFRFVSSSTIEANVATSTGVIPKA